MTKQEVKRGLSNSTVDSIMVEDSKRTSTLMTFSTCFLGLDLAWMELECIDLGMEGFNGHKEEVAEEGNINITKVNLKQE